MNACPSSLFYAALGMTSEYILDMRKKKTMQTKTFYANKGSPYRSRRVIRLVLALATALAGIANMLFVIIPRIDWSMLLGAWPLDMHHGLYKLTVVIGFFLLMLSRGLARGKR